jgi:polyisoprenoid-binding protein YceI
MCKDVGLEVGMNMRRALPSASLLLLVLACANPADDKPKAVVAPPEPAAAATAQAHGEVYRLEPSSTIGFVGSKVTGSHDGGFSTFEGEIELVGGDPAKSSVHVVIDTTSLWADNPKLTEHLKSPDFFDVAAHPTAEFTSTSIVREGSGYRVTGNLQLHGVEKSISFPATIELLEGAVSAAAEFAIKRFDFAIEYKGRADDLIRDDVVIKLDLMASRPTA